MFAGAKNINLNCASYVDMVSISHVIVLQYASNGISSVKIS